MSSDLLWLLVKKNNCFLVNRDGGHFSREPGNLRNIPSRKYSGLVQDRTVDLQPTANGVRVTIKSRKASVRRHPAKAYRSYELNKDFRRVAKSIKHEVDNYRPDLTKSALARWTKIHRSLKGGVRKGTTTRRAQRAARSKAT